MASSQDFVEYVAEQLGEDRNIIYRKMFGEYGIYCNGIFFAVICDDQLFIKVTEQAEREFPLLPKAPPYEGAKPWFYIENVDDRAFLADITEVTCLALSKSSIKKNRK